MPTKGNYKKKPRTKKRQSAKRNTFRSTFKCGDYHQLSFNPFSALSLVPSTTARFLQQDLTSISKGDLLTTRNSNLIYIKNINFRMWARNSGTLVRGLRLCIVRLRGSVNAADTTNFSDLFINNTFTKTGPTGNDYDGVLRINQDEWEKVYDRKWMLPGSLSGESATVNCSVDIPIRKYVSYNYNSSTVRKGQLWMIVMAYESPGTTPGAAFVATEGDFTMHYYDVNRVTNVP